MVVRMEGERRDGKIEHTIVWDVFCGRILVLNNMQETLDYMFQLCQSFRYISDATKARVV